MEKEITMEELVKMVKSGLGNPEMKKYIFIRKWRTVTE